MMNRFIYIFGIITIFVACNGVGTDNSFTERIVLDSLKFEDTLMVWTGEDGEGGFSVQGLNFVNNYDAVEKTWTGFVYSKNDNLTDIDSTNLATVVGAKAVSGDSVYVVGNCSGDCYIEVENGETRQFEMLYINNTLYADSMMTYGNTYYHKFGGEDEDEDEDDKLELIIEAIDSDNVVVGVERVSLADYTYSISSKLDNVLEEWTKVDLSAYGQLSKVNFSIESTIENPAGITPTFFALDYIVIKKD